MGVEGLEAPPDSADDQQHQRFANDHRDDQAVYRRHDIQDNKRVVQVDVSSGRVDGDGSEEEVSEDHFPVEGLGQGRLR